MRRSGQAVAVGNGAVALVLVAVLASIALVVRPPAPPGIAEFAPQATKPIAKAPLGQTAGSRPGTGAGCVPPSCLKPSHGKPSQHRGPGLPIPTPAGHASTVQCYSWPDGSVTQTFDSQSPPCIATWDDSHGNGGATTPGVTGSEIRVTVPHIGSSSLTPFEQALASFFNAHFMLYGRSIRLIPVDDSEGFVGAQGSPSPSGYKAVADKAAALKPFASLTTGALEPQVAPYVEELARHRVLSATATVSFVDTGLQERLAPYAWAYLPAVDTVERNLAALACSALVGHLAVHGGADVATEPRKFALLLWDGDSFPLAPLTDPMSACGSPVKVVHLKTDGATPADPATTEQFLQLKQGGYTTLITPHLGWSTFDALYATNAGYTPEWIVAGFDDQAAEGMFTSQGQRQQLAHAYGLGTWNKLLPWSQEPWYAAASAAGGQPQSGQIDQSGGQNLYHSLLLLASGIQLAGPHLTPATFAAGLHAATFANPGAGAAPSWQGSVGLQDGVSMVHDFALVWWNQSQRDYTSSPGGASGGGWCYLANGRRFTPETWPHADPQLNQTGPCT